MDAWRTKLRELKQRLVEEERVKKALASNRGAAQQPAAIRPEVQQPTRVGPQGGVPAGRPASRSPTASGYGLPPGPATTGSSVNVGIDYGTSTTKVCVRAGLGDTEGVPTYGVVLGRPGLTPEEGLLCPSLVGIARDGRLYFGREAIRHRFSEQSAALEHLKVCMACEAEGVSSALPGCHGIGGGDSGCRGTFLLDLDNGPVELRPAEMATLYIAWVIGEVGRRLPNDLRAHAGVRLVLNVGLPVGQVDTAGSLRKAYETVAFRAWRLSNGVTQGLPLARARAWLDEVAKLPVPPPNESPVRISSESEAALAAFAFSPISKAGLYSLVDIGAWTTDISFFRLERSRGSSDAAPAVAFYATDTWRTAVSDIDVRTLRALYDLWDFGTPTGSGTSLRAAAREVQEQRERDKFGTDSFSFDPKLKRRPSTTALQFPRECVAERLRGRFRQTIVQASEKEKRESSWKGFRTLVLGGGTKEEVLWRGLASGTPVGGTVEMLPGTKEILGVPPKLLGRFTVAAGLALPLALWHQVSLPSQVTPVEAPPPRPRPDSEDLGYIER